MDLRANGNGEIRVKEIVGATSEFRVLASVGAAPDAVEPQSAGVRCLKEEGQLPLLVVGNDMALR